MYTPRPLFLAGLLLAAHGHAAAAEACRPASAAQIAALFDHWNAMLQSGKAERVVANYAPRSVLLVPSSDEVLLSPAAKLSYYRHLVARGAAVQIDQRRIEADCDTATDAGTYRISFADGSQRSAGYLLTYRRFGTRWLIVTHRASWLPAQRARKDSSLSRHSASLAASSPSIFGPPD
ncbi:nuclear transport factor 2 family protein [Duganella sp.]|uniref:nuclear transport factor 2 family protein n=1 Tax=Duganella sp. TaxID=1904440 RepID=UPI0031DD1E2C